MLITCRPLLIFAACAVLFHFANAAMLPLVGQKFALQDKNSGIAGRPTCISYVGRRVLHGRCRSGWGTVHEMRDHSTKCA